MLILLILLLTIVNIALRISMGGIEVACVVADRADKARKGMEKTLVKKVQRKGNKVATVGAKTAKFGVDTAMVGVRVAGKVAKKASLLALKATIKLVRFIISLIRSGLMALEGLVLIFDVIILLLLIVVTAGYLVLFGGTDENGNLVINADVIATLGSPTAGGSVSGDNSSISGPVFEKYDLTDDEILQLASLCQQEQGTVAGAAAEASLMCNLYESYRGDNYDSLIEYVRDSGWFAHAETYMNKRNARNEIVNVVGNVIRKGMRVLPGYIDEHDYFGDITSATNDGVNIEVDDRTQYKKNVTVISNRYGSTYTFYCFPDSTSDPFGYTSEELRRELGDDCYTLEEAIAGVANNSSTEGNGEFLLSCDSPDSGYKGTTWTVDNRELLENLVSTEFGSDYTGAVLVAQALRDTFVLENTHDVAFIVKKYGYTGLAENPGATTQAAKDAVKFVFDEGGSGVQHRIMYMYNVYGSGGGFHETQNFIIQYKNVKFFDDKQL